MVQRLAHMVWDHEIEGSNPSTLTKKDRPRHSRLKTFHVTTRTNAKSQQPSQLKPTIPIRQVAETNPLRLTEHHHAGP